MLNVTMSKNLSGNSIIEGNVVASMYASIQDDGSVNINKNVMNNELYQQNKEAVRKDMYDFEQEAYKQEDIRTVSMEVSDNAEIIE